MLTTVLSKSYMLAG